MAQAQRQQTSKRREKYAIQKPLGKGSFGSVFLVQGMVSHDKFVIKRIDLNHLSEDMVRRQVNEVKVLEQLRHPNIIQHQDAFVDKKRRLNLRIEYADGGSLEELISQRKLLMQPLSEQAILNYVVQIGLAIKCCHERLIMHRDIKPDNVVLTSRGQAKLLDFGLSKILSDELAESCIGTPQYMAPEQFHGIKYNFKVDIWSFGVLIHRLMSFTYPFECPRIEEGAINVCRKQFKPLPDSYSVGLRNLVTTILVKDPSMRPDIYTVLRLPVLRPALVEYLKQDGFKQDLACILNSNTEKENQFVQLKQSNPAEIESLGRESEAGHEMLTPPESFQVHEGLEGYFEHTVRCITSGLTFETAEIEGELLVPEGEALEEIGVFEDQALQNQSEPIQEQITEEEDAIAMLLKSKYGEEAYEKGIALCKENKQLMYEHDDSQDSTIVTLLASQVLNNNKDHAIDFVETALTLLLIF